jgi:hypothetical protein
MPCSRRSSSISSRTPTYTAKHTSMHLSVQTALYMEQTIYNKRGNDDDIRTSIHRFTRL